MKKLFAFVLLVVLAGGVAVGGVALEKAQTDTLLCQKAPVLLNSAMATGEANHTSLHALTFNDKNTGWVIQDIEVKATGKTVSQLLETTDGGETWAVVFQAACKLHCVKFVNAGVGWMISESRNGQDYQILRSGDGGAHWAVQWSGRLTFSEDQNFDIWSDGIDGYCMVGDRLLATCDGGKHWREKSLGDDDIKPEGMSFANGEKGWVIGRQEAALGVWRTEDGGKSWQMTFRQADESGAAKGIGIQFVTNDIGWLLTSDMSLMMGQLYRTEDGGESWQLITDINSSRPTPYGLEFVSPFVGWIPLGVDAGPVSGGLGYTDDGGKTFRIVGQVPDDQAGQGIDSAREVEFASAQYGWAIAEHVSDGDYLVKTVDGGATWTQVYPRLSQ